MQFTSSSNQPAQQEQGGDYLNPKDMVGHLLLIWPIRYEADVPTKYPRLDGRPQDAVFVDLVDLSVAGDDGQPGKVMRQARWTQGRLIRDTKWAVGAKDPMLKQMTKDGDAFMLIEQANNPGSVQYAEWWVNAHPNFVPGADAPQQTVTPPPVPQPVPVPPAQAANPGVWPPASAPAQVPAAPYPHTSEQSAVLERLRAQAAQSKSHVDSSASGPTLPPPAPPFPVQDQDPPF